MSETRRTLIVGGVAAALVAMVWLTSPRSVSRASDERGDAFFPELTDPNAVQSLEVVEFDQEALVARPFKILNESGRWTIPSHQSYPADGGSRLSTIAAAIIALKKDEMAGDNVGDQERCGVLDPLDETLATATGRGTRITVRGAGDRMLADIIAGKAVEGRPDYRYMRVPGTRRIYVARVGQLDISTRFEDWIERSLLQIDRREIDRIIIRDYLTDPGTGRVQDRGVLSVRKKAEDVWALDDMGPRDTISTFNMNLLVTKLVDLEIAGVQRKPDGVTALLSRAESGGRLARSDAEELASRGFYFTSNGRLQSNQGEVIVHTSSGVFYVLRFGDIAHSAAAATSPDQRYLFVSAGFDSTVTGRVSEETSRRLDLLRARFSPWYYVVSNDSFRKIRLSRDELLTRQPTAPSPR